MALSTLANTTWQFNSAVIGTIQSVQYSITGYCGNEGLMPADKFINLNIGYNKTTAITTEVYVSVDREKTGTENIIETGVPLYQIIKFVGGDDIANTNLIAWVEGNATQLTVYDLSNLSITHGGNIELTAKAKAEGYTTSVASNAVTYTAPYTITPTLENVVADSDNVNKIYPNGTRTLLYYNDVKEEYDLPESLTVANADHTWQVEEVYNIHGEPTNLIINETKTYYNTLMGKNDSPLVLHIYSVEDTTAGKKYVVPSSGPAVTNAQGSYTRLSDDHATLTISEPTGDVVFSISGVEGSIGNKLVAPLIEVNYNDYDEYELKITNQNDVDVTCYSQDFGDPDYVDIGAKGAYFLRKNWTTGAKSHTISSYVTASGYTQSNLAVFTFRRPEGSNKVIVSNVTLSGTYEEESSPTPTMPSKGDLITMSLGNASPAAGTQDLYRVLNIDGTVAEVVAMYEANEIAFNTYTKSNVYNNSSLDNYLNKTWYNTLNDTAKEAIVDNDIVQKAYNYSGTEPSSYTYTYQSYSYIRYITLTNTVNVGSRHIYTLDLEDISNYVNSNYFSINDLHMLFFNVTTSTNRVIYLRSARGEDSSFAWCVADTSENFISYLVTISEYARPAFKIDLSKIDWSKSE